MGAVSMKTVALRAGVSLNAVSLALRGDASIPVATRERIRAVADEIGYRRNPLVSALMADRGMKRDPRSSGLTLGYMTMNKTRDDWRDFASPRRYFDGAARRAAELGYQLEPFWLGDPDIAPRRMEVILRTRNVQGLLFAPAPEMGLQIDIDCASYACVGLETCVALPVIHRVMPDQRHAMVESLKQLRLHGYRRVGLTLRRYADERAALNWSSTFQAFHGHLGMGHWIPPLWLEDRDPGAEKNRLAFGDWIAANRPDVILALDPVVETWLRALGKRVPKDVGLAYLEVTERTPGASGIERESERVGAAAIDLLVTMLNHNQRGLPAFDNVLLIKGTWVEGSTLKKCRQPAQGASSRVAAEG